MSNLKMNKLIEFENTNQEAELPHNNLNFHYYEINKQIMI